MVLIFIIKFLVIGPGLEPEMTEPKTVVLPITLPDNFIGTLEGIPTDGL